MGRGSERELGGEAGRCLLHMYMVNPPTVNPPRTGKVSVFSGEYGAVNLFKVHCTYL
jgi:hypothetical protein